MVKFNELYIDQLGDNLIIDVSILDLPYYKNDTIKAIYVIPEYNYQEGSVQGSVWTAATAATTVDQKDKIIPDNTKQYRVVIPQGELHESPYGNIIGLQQQVNEGVKTWLYDPCSPLGQNPDILDNMVPIHLEEHMFFVYVETVKATTNIEVPCFLDKQFTIGVVFYKGIIKRNMMQGVKEIESTCQIPKYFIDQHLRLTALEASIETDNFKEAIKYYRMFFQGMSNPQQNSITCNCGR